MLSITNIDTTAIRNALYRGFIFTADKPKHASIAFRDKTWDGWWWK